MVVISNAGRITPGIESFTKMKLNKSDTRSMVSLTISYFTLATGSFSPVSKYKIERFIKKIIQKWMELDFFFLKKITSPNDLLK